MLDACKPTIPKQTTLGSAINLPALGAAVLGQWVKARYGVRLIIMVVPHTFGGYLNLNPHLHILVSVGGLKESEGLWIATLRIDKNEVMEMWRNAVITYLREALEAHILRSDGDGKNVGTILNAEYERPTEARVVMGVDHKKYVFEGPNGKQSLAELFDGRAS
jgi:hypothetical protein